MSTQVIEAGKRSRMIAAFLALALALTVVLVATQAGRIRSTGAGLGPRPAALVASTEALNVHDALLPRGCHRPKFGCEHDGISAAKP